MIPCQSIELVESTLPERILTLRDLFSSVWSDSPAHFPFSTCRFSPQEQANNERQITEWLRQSNLASRSDRPDGNIEPADRERIKAGLRLLLRRSYLSADIQDDHYFDPWCDSAIEFIKQAEKFDHHLTQNDLFQAIRNIWICNGVQAYLGKPVVLTPSAFAYSLLYPYTDNYLDSPAVTLEAKADFLANVEDMLRGEEPFLRTPLLGQIGRLIAAIEEEYPRSEFPLVYESLLAIHRAQCWSLKEQGEDGSRPDVDLVGISMEKGGTSVLADAYLAGGVLTDGVEEFMFGLGSVLQLIDDLQDIMQDSGNRHSTIFTSSAKSGSLETMTIRLIDYTQRVLCPRENGRTLEARQMIALCNEGSLSLILESVARNASLYSPAFSRTLEPYSPVRFEALRRLNNTPGIKIGIPRP